MSTMLPQAWPLVSTPALGAVAGAGQSDSIRHCVELALASTTPERKGAERRRETRHAYPYPVHLTPIDAQGRPQMDDAVTVLGKHLSHHGLDFYHLEPLPWRRVIASLPGGETQWLGLLMDLTWCRFSQHGWYDNGGRFLGPTASPLNA